jgi:hypothetical protein
LELALSNQLAKAAFESVPTIFKRRRGGFWRHRHPKTSCCFLSRYETLFYGVPPEKSQTRRQLPRQKIHCSSHIHTSPSYSRDVPFEYGLNTARHPLAYDRPRPLSALRTAMLFPMSVALLTLLGISRVSAQVTDPQLTGTWSTKSNSTFTGPVSIATRPDSAPRPPSLTSCEGILQPSPRALD